MHHSLAISALLAVSNGTVTRASKCLQTLEQEFVRLQAHGDQDFIAFALCKSLLARDQRDRAYAILRRYIDEHRRERYQAPAYLTDLFKRGLE
jgi:hypothetical protein